MLLGFHYIDYQVLSTPTQRSYPNHHLLRLSTHSLPSKPYRKFPLPHFSSSSSSVSTVTTVSHITEEAKENDFDFLRDKEMESFNLDGSFELAELKRFESPVVEVKELEELPEKWRRSKLAWLCKELPAHRSGTFVRVLNAQRKWIRQDDCTYIAIHCMRIRENESAFRIDDNDDDIPCQFTTISHSYFQFYADLFWPQGLPVIPKLILRWLTLRVLAYWYMYGGYRTSSGDILLKLKFDKEDVLRIAKTIKTKSLNCQVKRKRRVFWMGFLGSDAAEFWKLTEPFVLADLKESLEANVESPNGCSGIKNINFSSDSDTDGNASDYSDDNPHNHL